MSNPSRIPFHQTIKRKAIYPITNLLFAGSSLESGTLKGTNISFRCLFVGGAYFNDRLRDRMYKENTVVLRRGHVLIPTLPSILRLLTQSIDLCVATLPFFYDPIFRRVCDYSSRQMYRQIIDTSAPWNEIRKAFSKRKRTISNNFSDKYELSLSISNSSRDFDLFYTRMYVPYAQKRFGEFAVISSYEELKRIFLDGKLFFVVKDNTLVSGAVCHIKNGILYYDKIGVLDGNETILKSGASTAILYFLLKFACANGLLAVDAGNSAPFLNDGVFRHKAEWGARAIPDSSDESRVYVFTPGPPNKIRAFFEVNPLIIEEAHSWDLISPAQRL